MELQRRVEDKLRELKTKKSNLIGNPLNRYGADVTDSLRRRHTFYEPIYRPQTSTTTFEVNMVSPLVLE